MDTKETRYQELLDYFHVDQMDMVRKTGIPKSSISMYVNGQRKPRQNKLTLIANAYGVQEAWLMGYDVPMLNDDNPAVQKKLDTGIVLGELFKMDFDGVAELIQIFRDMTDSQRKEYLKIGKVMLKGKE